MSQNKPVELSADARSLLQAERVPEAIPAGSAARVLQRLTDTLALAPLAAPPSLPASPSSALSSGLASGLKAKALTVLLALGGAAGVALFLRESPETERRPPLSSPPAAVPLTPTASVVPGSGASAVSVPSVYPSSGDREAGGSVSSVKGGRTLAGAGDTRPSPSSLADERALLDDARAALSSRNAGAALRALAAHERRSPRGRLTEERESLIVQALAHTSGAAAARRRFAAFRQRFPKSIFTPALQAVVDSLP